MRALTTLPSLIFKHGLTALILVFGASMILNQAPAALGQNTVNQLSSHTSKVLGTISPGQIETQISQTASFIKANVSPVNLASAFTSKSRSSSGSLAINHGPIFLR